MVIGFACRRPKGDSHFAFASLPLKLFLHMHQQHYDVNLATSASKRRANQKSLVGVCVCVRVCVYVVLWQCGTPPPSTTGTRCCGDFGQCLVLLIGFWRPPPPSTKIRRCGDFGSCLILVVGFLTSSSASKRRANQKSLVGVCVCVRVCVCMWYCGNVVHHLHQQPKPGAVGILDNV